MARSGQIRGLWVVLAFVGFVSGEAWPDDAVTLRRWADEGVMVPGKGMGEDLVLLVAEGEWAASAPRDPARYFIRVAFPDGRVDSRPFPVDYPPDRRRFPVYIPANPVRDLSPSAVKVAVTVVDASSGSPVSNPLMASIADFPRPKGDASANDPGPFGRGKPLSGPSRLLPTSGPDGLRFARVAGPGGAPGFFVATTEASVEQVGKRLQGYDPKAGRSDEFALEDPSQPAINLNPSKARAYLEALGKSDLSGVSYRLPTIPEWSEAARGGKASAFWWGDEPTFPAGANLLGPEPALPGDATAPALPPEASPSFEANPFGLAHTFGNAAEWASDPAGGFARMGGHFRTEPASPLPLVKVEKDDELGPDPFVGVRPVADLTADSASALIRKRLAGDARLAGVVVAYDPETATATLTGPVADSPSRRAADVALDGLWFIAAVDNQLATPTLQENQLAVLGQAGPARRLAILDRTFVEVRLPVRWLDPLPVAGSSWWVNIYPSGGGHQAHKLDPVGPARSKFVIARVDREALALAGQADDAPFRVALSLGGPAADGSAPGVVSNAVEVRPAFVAKPR